MLTVEQCRRHADECIALAEDAAKEHVPTLHKIAESWLRLAEEILDQEPRINGDGQIAPSADRVQ